MITSVFHPERWTQSSPQPSDNLSTALPPDILLILDDEKTTKLFAHRFVLAFYSGYFRALFASYNGFEVHISNVDPTIFSILLGYMYTGQLHVTSKNVYDLLIASNFLYILPIADLCKEYLIREQQLENVRMTSVIRPIPRRTSTIIPVAVHKQTVETLKYQPLRINDDGSSIFKPVRANFANLFKRAQPSIASTESSSSSEGGDKNQQQKNDSTTTMTTSTDKIIYDIACCDGPIKFQKVVNQFYKPCKVTNEIRTTSACRDYKTAMKSYRGRQQLRKTFNDTIFLLQEQDDDTTINTSSEAKFSTTPTDEESVSGNDELCSVRNVSSDVQFYPCKSCGSKFPSYYFVNKHRKLCHANENDTCAIKD